MRFPRYIEARRESRYSLIVPDLPIGNLVKSIQPAISRMCGRRSECARAQESKHRRLADIG